MSEYFWYVCLDCQPKGDGAADFDDYRTDSVNHGGNDMKLILTHWDSIALPVRKFQQDMETLGATVQVGLSINPRYSGDYFYTFLEEHLSQGHTVAVMSEYKDEPLMTHREGETSAT